MKILALAPHTDDVEFGCGGTIHRLIEEGHEVRYIAFSDCKESVPAGFEEDVLRFELINAVKHLGIKKEKVKILDYKVRKFNFSRQEILEDLVKIQREFMPDIVFTPCSTDIHQDHSTITEEATRAFKRSTIYGYELPWNLFELPSRCLFKLEEKNLIAKNQAIAEYKTQYGRGYSNPDYINALALTRGTRIGEKFAEAFEVIRLIN
ncbi:PIG-L family deacetylase [Saprospiraceae bacterium]|nr:PIG-L family deacetylase [Saprospiraceae bacterium]